MEDIGDDSYPYDGLHFKVISNLVKLEKALWYTVLGIQSNLLKSQSIFIGLNSFCLHGVSNVDPCGAVS